MKKALAFCSIISFSLISCGDSRPPYRGPVSVRGYIESVPGTVNLDPRFKVVAGNPEAELFKETSISVDNTEFASGNVADDGTFVLLDVPSGEVVLTFTAPGAPEAKLSLGAIPPSADVLLLGVVVKPDSVDLLDPTKAVVRLVANKDGLKPYSSSTVDGVSVPVQYVPLAEMSDRRDYPNRPRKSSF